MLRQITEAVQIDNVGARELMNTRAEWDMTRVPRAAITHEQVQGTLVRVTGGSLEEEGTYYYYNYLTESVYYIFIYY